MRARLSGAIIPYQALLLLVLLLLAYVAMAANDGSAKGVKICYSSPSSPALCNSLAEINFSEPKPTAGDLNGDNEMDLLARNIRNQMLPDIAEDKISDQGTNAKDTNTMGILHISWLSESSTAENLTNIVSLEEFIPIATSYPGRNLSDADSERIGDHSHALPNIAEGYKIALSNNTTSMAQKSKADNLTVIVSLDKLVNVWGNFTEGSASIDKQPPA